MSDDSPLDKIKERVRTQRENGTADLVQYRLDRLEERVGLLETDLKTLLTDTAAIKTQLESIPTKADLADHLLNQQRWMIGVLITVALGSSAMIVHAIIRMMAP